MDRETFERDEEQLHKMSEAEIDVSVEDYEKFASQNKSKSKKKQLENENEVIARAQKDDQNAWEILFREYAPFINYMKAKMRVRIFGRVTEEDLESQIYEGFVRAVREYDETVGAKFLTFAVTVVKNWAMRLSQRNSRVYYQEDVLARADMMPATMVEIDATQDFGKGDDARPMSEVIADSAWEDELEYELNSEFASKIIGLVENDYAKDYFITSSSKKITFEDIAKKYDVSKETISQCVQRERRKISGIIHFSRRVKALAMHGKDAMAISKILNISLSEVDYFAKMHKYLFEHGEKVGKLGDRDEVAILKCFPFVKDQMLKNYILYCFENGYVSLDKYYMDEKPNVTFKELNHKLTTYEKHCKKLFAKCQLAYNSLNGETCNLSVFDNDIKRGLSIADYAEGYKYLTMGGEFPSKLLNCEIFSQEEAQKSDSIKKITVRQELSERMLEALKKYRPLLFDKVSLYRAYPVLVAHLTEGKTWRELGVNGRDLKRAIGSAQTRLQTTLLAYVKRAEVFYFVESEAEREKLIKEYNISAEEAGAYRELYAYFFEEGELPKYFALKEEALIEKAKIWGLPLNIEEGQSVEEFLYKKKSKEEQSSKESKEDDFLRIRKGRRKAQKPIEKMLKEKEGLFSGGDKTSPQVLVLTTGDKIKDDEYLKNLIKKLKPLYETQQNSASFMTYLYESYVEGKSDVEISKLTNVTRNTVIGSRSRMLREVENVVTTAEVCNSLIKNSRTDLMQSANLEPELVSYYSNLYEYLFNNGELPLGNGLPKRVGSYRKVKALLISLSKKGKDLFKSNQSEKAQIENPEYTIEKVEEITAEEPLKENVVKVEVSTNKEVVTQIVEESLKEDTVTKNVEESSKTDMIVAQNVEVKVPKRRGRPKKTESLAKDEQKQMESTREEKTEPKKVKGTRKSKVEGNSNTQEGELVSFTKSSIIEKVAGLFKYDMRFKALKLLAVDKLNAESIANELNISSDQNLKGFLDDAEIELLGFLQKVKRTTKIEDKSKLSGEDRYMASVMDCLSGKSKPRFNFVEYKRILEFLDEDLTCQKDFTKVKEWLESGLSIEEYTKNKDDAKQLYGVVFRQKVQLEKEAEMAKSVFDARVSGQDITKIAQNHKISEDEITKYIDLYEFLSYGKSTTKILESEKRARYIKLLDFVDEKDAMYLQSFLLTKTSICEVAKLKGEKLIDVKQKISEILATMEHLICQARDVKMGKTQQLRVDEVKFFENLYTYLYEDGEQPVRPMRTKEMLEKLLPVLGEDKKFIVAYKSECENLSAKEIAELTGIGAKTATVYKSKVIADLTEILDYANKCHKMLEENMSVDSVARELDIRLDAVENMSKLYSYLNNGGECVKLTSASLSKLGLVKGSYNIQTDKKKRGAKEKMEKAEELKQKSKKKVEDKKDTKTEKQKDSEFKLNSIELISKIANFYPYDLRIQALSEELRGGVTFNEALKRLGYDLKDAESLRAETLKSVEDICLNVIKIGKPRYNPRPKLGVLAEEFGVSAQDVSCYQKMYKHFFSDGEMPKENPFEIRRIAKLMKNELGISESFDMITSVFINGGEITHIAKANGVSASNAFLNVSKEKSKLLEILKDVTETKKQVLQGKAVEQVAKERQMTGGDVERDLRLFNNIYFLQNESRDYSKEKDLFKKLKSKLVDADQEMLAKFLEEGKTVLEIANEMQIKEKKAKQQIAEALERLGKINHLAKECKKLLSAGENISSVSTRLNISKNKVVGYAKLYDCIYNDAQMPIGVENLNDKHIYELLSKLYAGSYMFDLAYRNIVKGETMSSIAKQIGRSIPYVQTRIAKVKAGVGQIINTAENYYYAINFEGATEEELSDKLRVSRRQINSHIALFEALYLGAELNIDGKSVELNLNSTGNTSPASPKLAEAKQRNLTRTRQTSHSANTIQVAVSRELFRQECKTKLKNFMMPKVKKNIAMQQYFAGEDISVVTKSMGLSLSSTIDQILQSCTRETQNSLKRGKREGVPTAYEIYSAVVPFDEEVYREPLQAQLNVMRCLPLQAYTKLIRAVDTAIKNADEDIKRYVTQKYLIPDKNGGQTFDYASMLGGDDHLVKALYPSIQKEFTYILDKARTSWQM